MSDLAFAKAALDREDFAAAAPIIDAALTHDPYDAEALFLLSRAMLDGGKPHVALATANLLCYAEPQRWQGYLMAGKALDDLRLHDQAMTHYRMALDLSPDNGAIHLLFATNAVARHAWDDVKKYADLAEKTHHCDQIEVCRAFYHLHRREYSKGWAAYEHGINVMDSRDERCFAGEPRWAGQPGPILAVHTEQGLGDQIAFMSVLPDVTEDIALIECHPKLVRLFQSAVPDAMVIPDTQLRGQPDNIPHYITEHVAMASLHGHYRHSLDEYHATRGDYLRSALCDVRGDQWRSKFEGSINIGIAWTGGRQRQYQEDRNLTLEHLAPLLDVPGVNWVDLEYRDSSDEERERVCPGLFSPAWATRSHDYMDTACLVAALDAVVCVPTSVYHIAGAVGTPAMVLTGHRPHFHESDWEGRSPYYESVELVSRKLGEDRAIRKATEFVRRVAGEEKAA